MDPKGNYVESLGKVNDMASLPSDRAGHPRIALIASGAANSPFGSARSLITNTWRSLMSEPPVSSCVVAYDVENQKVVGDLLLVNTPRRITVSKDGEFAILSICGSEWGGYLELWRIVIPDNLEDPLSLNMFTGTLVIGRTQR